MLLLHRSAVELDKKNNFLAHQLSTADENSIMISLTFAEIL